MADPFHQGSSDEAIEYAELLGAFWSRMAPTGRKSTSAIWSLRGVKQTSGAAVERAQSTVGNEPGLKSDFERAVLRSAPNKTSVKLYFLLFALERLHADSRAPREEQAG